MPRATFCTSAPSSRKGGDPQDEDDLDGKGGVDELWRAPRDEHERQVVQGQRPIDRRHHRLGAACFAADHDAVRPLPMAPSREFGVRDDVELEPRGRCASPPVPTGTVDLLT